MEKQEESDKQDLIVDDEPDRSVSNIDSRGGKRLSSKIHKEELIIIHKFDQWEANLQQLLHSVGKRRESLILDFLERASIGR